MFPQRVLIAIIVIPAINATHVFLRFVLVAILIVWRFISLRFYDNTSRS